MTTGKAINNFKTAMGRPRENPTTHSRDSLWSSLSWRMRSVAWSEIDIESVLVQLAGFGIHRTHTPTPRKPHECCMWVFAVRRPQQQPKSTFPESRGTINLSQSVYQNSVSSTNQLELKRTPAFQTFGVSGALQNKTYFCPARIENGMPPFYLFQHSK